MAELMIALLNVSMQAAVVICVVLLVRLIFAKLHISKKYVSLLWLLPYLCLILPWRPESSFSVWGVFPGLEPGNLPQINKTAGMLEVREPMLSFGEMEYAGTEYDGIQIEQNTEAVWSENINVPENVEMAGNLTANTTLNFENTTITIVATIVWIIGVTALLIYSVVSYVRLRKKVLCSICLEDNIYIADDIAVPFVLGFIKQRIYLPTGLKHENLQFVIEHEKTHILRKDSWKKAAAFLITCVHWFNPLIWVAFCFLGKDIEMACDEETVQRIGVEKKRDYASALLMVASGKNTFRTLAVPLAFGEGDTKGRIQNILKYKRTAGIIAGIVIVFIIVLCAVFLTQPGNALKGSEAMVQNAETLQQTDEPMKEAEATEMVDVSDIPKDVEEIAITAPVMSSEVISGADGPILDYASEDTVIFHDYYGLYAYRLEQGIIGAIDLKAIGCQYTQGDDACQVVVEQDGSKVYLHPMNSEEMYVYDVEQAALSRQKDEMGSIDGFFKIKDINDCIAPDDTVLRSGQCIMLTSGYHYLESGSGLPIDLAWVVKGTNSKETKPTRYVKLFEGYVTDTGEVSADSGIGSSTLESSEPIILEEFTMEKLISLCEEGREALKTAMDEFLVRDGMVYSNFVRHTHEYSLTDTYVCELSYESKEYELQVNYWKPEKAREYGHTEYEIDGISIYETASEDAQLLYTNEPERYIENRDLLSFLGKKYDIAQYLTLTVPESLTMTSYKKGMNTIWDGCMFVGELKEQPHGNSCSEAWYAPGGVGMFDGFEEDPLFINSFENGRLTEIHWLQNHVSRETEGEYLEGCDRQAMLYEYSFDVFTPPEAEEYWEKYGLKEGELQATSKYWYVFFSEPDCEFIYTVFLNQQYFSKEDVIALARSVKFVQ